MTQTRRIRHGFTLLETIVVIVIIIVVAALAIPLLMRFWEDRRRDVCTGHLRQIGKAFANYKSSDKDNTLPAGARYHAETQSAGTSWWVDILPRLEVESQAYQWKRGPDCGDFGNSKTANENTAWADGRQVGTFFCPSSPLPLFNDPQKHMSAANRELVAGGSPKGIPVPMYVAIAGSAPDAAEFDVNKLKDEAGNFVDVGPFGRNTKDHEKWGILSGSGMFPPNSPQTAAALEDQQNRMILVAEQSNYLIDNSLDPPEKYDIRSAWPKGAFMGTAGDYGEIKLGAAGLNGDGGMRCWNITTVRYPLNISWAPNRRGVVVDPPNPRPAKEGEPAPPPPPYPEEGYGPGHNQPIVSAHPGGVNLLMADGSADFTKENLDFGILLRMCTRNDQAD